MVYTYFIEILPIKVNFQKTAFWKSVNKPKGINSPLIWQTSWCTKNTKETVAFQKVSDYITVQVQKVMASIYLKRITYCINEWLFSADFRSVYFEITLYLYLDLEMPEKGYYKLEIFTSIKHQKVSWNYFRLGWINIFLKHLGFQGR